MIQRSPEWFAARLGHVTASRISDVVARTKSGPSAMRKNYKAQLVLERLTGQPMQTYQNAAMLLGIEREPIGRANYALEMGVIVVETDFVPHSAIAMAGASPDGYVGEQGLVEIKCPNQATHLETLENSTIDMDYIKQMQFQMACTSRDWCDFVSYNPDFPQHMQLWIKRIERDPEMIEYLEQETSIFLQEIDATVATLRKRYALEQAA